MTSSDQKPLKSLSETCRFLRAFCFEELFKHACLKPVGQTAYSSKDNEPALLLVFNTKDVEDFLAFILENELHVQSVAVVTQQNLYSQYLDIKSQMGENGIRGCFAYSSFWRRIMDVANPRSITMCCPPTTLASLISCTISVVDEGAFSDMPLHVLHLSCPQNTVQAQTPLPITRGFDLFYLRPWTDFVLNESSSLSVYRTYEYYLKSVPSITRTFPGLCGQIPVTSMENMRFFDYIAVFPLSENVAYMASVLHCFPNLERFGIQLAPDSNNPVLYDRARMMAISPADLWMELDMGYKFVLENLQLVERAPLLKFECFDYSVDGLQSSLDEIFQGTLTKDAGTGSSQTENIWTMNPRHNM
ncbi:hypothetical protein MMC09_000107 [Bachmanniomyces sp. S44760]|nr:hypothetical protein [Bachmanniomyces sp. S44760]